MVENAGHLSLYGPIVDSTVSTERFPPGVPTEVVEVDYPIPEYPLIEQVFPIEERLPIIGHEENQRIPQTIQQVQNSEPKNIMQSAIKRSLAEPLTPEMERMQAVAMEAIYTEYQPIATRYVSHMVDNYDIAQDIVQKAMIKINDIYNLTQGPFPKSLLFKILSTTALDELRKRKKAAILFSNLEEDKEEGEGILTSIVDDAANVPAIVEQHERDMILQQAIGSLPDIYRSIVQLRYMDLMFKEIGEKLGMPESTVKTYFYRARPLLRKALQTLEYE